MSDSKREAPANGCWACECGVPLVGEMHEEPMEIPGTVYVYPCARQRGEALLMGGEVLSLGRRLRAAEATAVWNARLRTWAARQAERKAKR